MYSHQDWTPVVIKKNISTIKKELVPKSEATKETKTITGRPAWAIEKQVDDEKSKPVIYVSSETAKEIISGRLSMKLTQKQLAQKLNIQEKDIKDIESCKAVLNKGLISRIKKTLNIQ